MEERNVLVLRNAPSQPEAIGALWLAAALQHRGSEVTLVLLQDSVLCALKDSALVSACRLRAVVADGARCYYLADDLAMRGYTASEVAPGCEPTGYDGVVDLALADGASVAGAF